MELICGLALGLAMALAAWAGHTLWRQRKGVPAQNGRWIYDLQLCLGLTELNRFLDEVNRCGYLLVGVTEDETGYYTLFFSRPRELSPDG